MTLPLQIADLIEMYRTLPFSEIDELVRIAEIEHRNAPRAEKSDAYADLMAIKSVAAELARTGTLAA